MPAIGAEIRGGARAPCPASQPGSRDLGPTISRDSWQLTRSLLPHKYTLLNPQRKPDLEPVRTPTAYKFLKHTTTAMMASLGLQRLAGATTSSSSLSPASYLALGTTLGLTLAYLLRAHTLSSPLSPNKTIILAPSPAPSPTPTPPPPSQEPAASRPPTAQSRPTNSAPPRAPKSSSSRGSAPPSWPWGTWPARSPPAVTAS